MKFETHKELDEFVQRIIDNFPNFMKDYHDTDAALLKSFDRAFWLKHYKLVSILF